MKPRLLYAAVSLTLPAVILLGAWVFSQAARAAEQPKAANGKRVPVIVELFTSEGCSSCPPADALLRKLDADQPVEGAEVIILGEHVDYWNYIGWTDRFSSSQFTERQDGYVQSMNLDSAYTPQMIVDGTRELNGTDERGAKKNIAASAQKPKGDLQISLSKKDGRDDAYTARITASGVDAKVKSQLYLAVTENGLESQVNKGENDGRYLRHSGVVRRLSPMAGFDPAKPNEATVRIEKDWKPENVRVIAFVQQADRRIVAAVSVPLPK